MFSQDENPVSDASNTRRILTPISDTSLNGSDGSATGGKKRKRDGNAMEDLLKDVFVVKPYPSTGFVKSRTLQPLVLLPRSHLPLSSLDLAPSINALPPSRLFETHVKILELEERMGSQPMVLIARLDDGRTLYAVEREDRGLYVLCQLGSWTNLQELRAVATVSGEALAKPSARTLGLPRDVMSAPLITPESSKYSKKKRLAIEAIQSMVKRPSTGLVSESQSEEMELESQPQPESQSLPHQEQQPPGLTLEDALTQPTSSEIFENIRNQYSEALYLSKASLAYFAKGPLSRARAAFHLDYDSTLDMNEYIAFLESLIMTTTLIDKKYKDGVPGCVSLIDIHDHSADDANQAGEKAKKRKSNKKMKPGKTGLYPSEDVLVRKWWVSHDDEIDSGAPGASKENITRNRISQLRIRETQLQITIMLEVLALHPLASASEEVGIGLPTALPSNSPADGNVKVVKSKSRDHLTKFIDVHIDRLCIWQSIALEDIKTTLDSVPHPEDFGSSSSLPKHADNFLRDFCVEVIVPFFLARLPDICADISRKLGGPIVVSPKPKLSKSSSFSGVISRPGAATKRPVPAKSCRSLQRVRTDERERRSESRGPNRAISLMRSATVPIVPGLKREASEAPLLSSIPTTDSQPLQAHRGGVLNSKRFSHREVDMSSLAPDVSSKAKKQASIEAELREAISALKKPNRELAGKALAETAEQRSASASHPRKSKKPVRNPLFQGIQISATPRANRRKNVPGGSQRSSFPKMSEEMDMTVIPPSSLLRIPQSVARKSGEIQPKNPLLSMCQATPTRKSLPAPSRRASGYLGVDAGDNGSYFPSSPLQPRRSSNQMFIVVPDSAVKGLSQSQGIQETPVKRRTNDVLGHGHPIMTTTENDKENSKLSLSSKGINFKQQIANSEEDSIYKSLGWDDGDDIDELA